MRKLSAKDKAFEKERVKFRKELREYQSKLSDRDNEIFKLKKVVDSLEDELSIKDDYIEQLRSIIGKTEDEIEYLLSQKTIVTQLDELQRATKVLYRSIF